MNRILHILLVLSFVVVLSGTYFGCSSSSKKTLHPKHINMVRVEDADINAYIFWIFMKRWETIVI